MEISKNFSRYDTAIQQPSITSQAQQVASKSTIKSFTEAYKVDISDRALASAEFNDSSISFPVHDEDVLQYNQNLDITYKP